MIKPYVTSVADAMPFDPAAPSTIPTSTGYNLSWNKLSQVWEVTSKARSQQQIWVPEFITATSSGIHYLDTACHSSLIISGMGSNFSIYLPDATALELGNKYEIYNTTPYTIAIYDKSGYLLFSLGQSSIAYIYLKSNTTLAGTWISWQILQTTPTASGIINYKITSSTPFSTTSASDVIITGFTVTPETGTYAVWVSADAVLSANNSLETFTVYRNASAITDSKRITQGSSSNFKTSNSTLTTATFNGLQACNIYVSISSGTLSIGQRTLLLIRLGT